MAITLNAKGTSVPYFTVGKGGVTIYQGTSDPSTTYTLKTGDYWLDSAINAILVWSTTTSSWLAPRIADLHFVSSTITAPSATDITMSTDTGHYVTVSNGTAGPGLITASSSQDLHINPATGGGQYLFLNANRWPTADGSVNQTLTTNGAGVLSFTNTAALYLPSGATSARPTGVAGNIRFNTDNQWFEGYNGTAWYAVGGAPSVALFNLSYTYTGTLTTAPVGVVVPPVATVNGYIANYAGVWASTFTLSSNNASLTTITFSNIQTITGSIIINSIPSLTGLGLASLTTIYGAFSLASMSGLTSLDLSSLASVNGIFNPSNLSSLTSLTSPAMTSSGSYQPTTMSSLTTLSSAILATVTGDFSPNTLAALTTFSFPKLATISGYFNPSGLNSLTTLSLPALTSVAQFNPNSMSNLTTLSCVALTTVSSFININTMPALTGISLPALTSVGGDINLSLMAVATSVSLSALANTTGRLIVSNMAALTSIDLSSTITLGSSTTSGSIISLTSGTAAVTSILFTTALKQVGSGAGNIIITSAALTSSNVDSILVRLAALDGTNSTTAFSNRTVIITGTSGTPSSTGTTAKNTLVSRGCSVTTN